MSQSKSANRSFHCRRVEGNDPACDTLWIEAEERLADPRANFPVPVPDIWDSDGCGTSCKRCALRHNHRIARHGPRAPQWQICDSADYARSTGDDRHAPAGTAFQLDHSVGCRLLTHFIFLKTRSGFFSLIFIFLIT
jgi:hypothetical protein